MTNMPKSPAAKTADEKAVTTAAVKTEEVEAVVAPAAPAAEEKKTPAAEKKAPARKTAAPKAAKKAVEKVEKLVEKVEKKSAARKTAKTEPKSNIVVEYQGRQVMQDSLVERAKQLWANSGRAEEIQEMELYVKPEDSAVYCVINGEAVGKFSF